MVVFCPTLDNLISIYLTLYLVPNTGLSIITVVKQLYSQISTVDLYKSGINEMLELLPAALATELLICPDSLSCENVLSADPHILHGVTVNLQIRGQNDWKWMGSMIINRSWVTNCGAWSWALGEAIINFRALQRIRRSLGRRVLTLHPSFVQSWKYINQSVWAEMTLKFITTRLCDIDGKPIESNA